MEAYLGLDKPLILRYDPNLDPILRIGVTLEEQARATETARVSDLIRLRWIAENRIKRELESISLEPWYHHPHDKMENTSADRMRIALEIVAAASLQVICTDGMM